MRRPNSSLRLLQFRSVEAQREHFERQQQSHGYELRKPKTTHFERLDLRRWYRSRRDAKQ